MFYFLSCLLFVDIFQGMRSCLFEVLPATDLCAMCDSHEAQVCGLRGDGQKLVRYCESRGREL